MSYDGEMDTITAKTRGRAPTPFDPGKSPKDYKLETIYNLNNHIVKRVTQYYPELERKLMDLIKVKDISTLFNYLKKEFNTIVALLYQGGENGKTKVTSWEYEGGSILDEFVRNKNVYIKLELNMTNFSSHLFRYLLEALGGEYKNLGNVLSLKKPKILTKLKYD